MKKQFTIHLDALLVIALLFLVSVGFNILQAKQVSELGKQTIDQQFEILQKVAQIAHQQQQLQALEKQKSQQ